MVPVGAVTSVSIENVSAASLPYLSAFLAAPAGMSIVRVPDDPVGVMSAV